MVVVKRGVVKGGVVELLASRTMVPRESGVWLPCFFGLGENGHSPRRGGGGYNAEGMGLGLRHIDLLMDR